jgi:general secretion pathway protein A
MLYSNFYGINRDPFSLSPDPAFMLLTPSHREALAQMRYTVEARRGFAVITGEVGTGKTTLLRSLLGSIGPNVITAYILNPPRTRGELYTALASELGIHVNGSETWLIRTHDYLIEQARQGRTVVALFDEAQLIPTEVLEEIRLLTNLETAEAKLLQVILAGQPELDTIIDSDSLRALCQRIALRHALEPLSRSETMAYIAGRLRLAGANRMLFDRAACDAVHEYSKGIPRLINSLCETSLIAGFVAERPKIDVRIVAQAARDAHLKVEPKRTRNYRRVVASIFAVATIAALSVLILRVSSVSTAIQSLVHAVLNYVGAQP